MTVMKPIFMKQNLVAIAFWLMTGLCSSTTALAQWRADALVPETGKDYAVVAFSANLMREEPAFEAEMGDQALMGTVVEILDRKGSWVQIRTGEPYTAWVTELGLAPMDAEALKAYAAAQPGWTLAPNNFEGVRVNLDKDHGDGWFLLRLSLHDPLLPLNIESDSEGGVRIIARELLPFLARFDKLDIAPLRAFLG